jgi:hypothetical protein
VVLDKPLLVRTLQVTQKKIVYKTVFFLKTYRERPEAINRSKAAIQMAALLFDNYELILILSQ